VRTETQQISSPARQYLDLEVGTGADGYQLRLSGELDYFSALQLLDWADAFTRNHSRGRLVVMDLAGLTFCDAGGISAMLKIHRSLTAGGARLVVRGAAGPVRRVFAITGADQTLQLR
jgi:anti-sigma B factor antagonist